MKDERFAVSIKLDVNLITEDGLSDYFDSTVNYNGLDYKAVVGIEQLMLGVLEKLGEAGVKKAAGEHVDFV